MEEATASSSGQPALGIDEKQFSPKTVQHSLYLFTLCLSFLLFIWVVIVYSHRFALNPQSLTANIDLHRSRFNKYAKKFNKTYNETEYFKRLEYFKVSHQEIKRLNKAARGVTRYGYTKFADMCKEEFRKTMLLNGDRQRDRWEVKTLGSSCRRVNKTCEGKSFNVSVTPVEPIQPPLPLKFDWRDRGVVGPVLNQGYTCPVCWAFSAIGVTESMAAIQTRKFTRLSIQEVIDFSSNHCATGNIRGIIEELCNENLTITTEAEYPLKLRNETPWFTPQKGWLLTEMQVECDKDSDYIADLVAQHGPVAIKVNANSWMYYLDGIIRFNCESDEHLLTHVVQIVGYDKTAETPHFILRNSWGADTGDDGYVKVAMGNFICGVGKEIVYFDVGYRN